MCKKLRQMEAEGEREKGRNGEIKKGKKSWKGKKGEIVAKREEEGK